jgi:hypothetical protein
MQGIGQIRGRPIPSKSIKNKKYKNLKFFFLKEQWLLEGQWWLIGGAVVAHW